MQHNISHLASLWVVPLLLIALTTLTTNPTQAQDCPIDENFDSNNGNGGNDGTWQGITQSTPMTNPTDWENEKGFAANKCIRVGSSSAKGHITTCAIGSAGNFTITFRAGSWTNDATTLKIEPVDGGTLDITSQTLTNGAWGSYTINLTDATAQTKIKFYTSAAKKRFFLDDVKICSATPAGTPRQFTYNLPNISHSYTQTTIYDGQPFTDTLKPDVCYTIGTVTVTMGGTAQPDAYNAETGVIYIGNVTGNINITATANLIKYSITSTLTRASNSNEATEIDCGANYTAELTAESGYMLSNVSITMGGNDITTTAYNDETGQISINNVSGNIAITATGVRPYSVTYILTHVSSNNNAEQVAAETAYTTTLSAESGFVIETVTVTMGDANVTQETYDATTHEINIASVTGNITIAATGHELECPIMEDFDNVIGTGGNDENWGQAGTTFNFPDNSDWSCVGGAEAMSCIKLGSGSTIGSITTPAISAGDYTLTFKIGPWSSDDPDIDVIAINANNTETTITTLSNLEESKFTIIRTNIVDAAEGTKIKIAAKAKKKRFFIDSIYICHESSSKLSVEPDTLRDFLYSLNCGPSAAQAFVLTGERLTNDVTLNAPANYELSTSAEGSYSGTMTCPPDENGNISETIYVRLKAELAVGTYTGDITMTCEGVSHPPTVHLEGEVVEACVTNLKVICTTNSTAEITWTPPASGTYESVVIAMRQSTNEVAAGNTLDYSNITANSQFGQGTNFGSGTPQSCVVYQGTDNSVTVTGLERGQPYSIKAFTYMENGHLSMRQPTTAISALGVGDVAGANVSDGDGQASLGWSPPNNCYDEFMIVCQHNATVTATPTGDGSSYTANSVFGSGAAISGSEYIVFKGSDTHCTITGLENGQIYYAKIFVRKGSDWSTGVEIVLHPKATTILKMGDLAIVAINTNNNKKDEISFVSFKDIEPGTAIDMTDNGYGRTYENLWGTSEGVLRFTRQNSLLLAGHVITTIVPANNSNIKVFIDGNDDTNNWDITTIPGFGTSFDLNVRDQIWIMQGGIWSRSDNLFVSGIDSDHQHNAYYSGNVLYGWTATGWKTHHNWEHSGGAEQEKGTRGSMLFPTCECGNTNVISTNNQDKIKYKGDTAAATRQEWIGRINDPRNWKGYSNNNDYDNGDYKYKTDSITFIIIPGEFTAGRWSGFRDSQWCNCANWYGLVVPDENTDVTIPSHDDRRNDLVLSGHSDSLAVCQSIKIDGKISNRANAKLLIKNGNMTCTSTADIDFGTNAIAVEVTDSVTVDTAATFNFSQATFTFNGPHDQKMDVDANEIKNVTLKGITTANSGTKTLADNIDVSTIETQLGTTLQFDAHHITLSGNWTNSGNYAGDENDTLTFNGSEAQTLSGNKVRFKDVVLNNTHVTVNSKLEVIDKMNLKSARTAEEGILTVGESGELYICKDADIINADTLHFVDGKITKQGGAEYKFPTGDVADGVKHYAEFVSAPQSGSDEFETSVKYNSGHDGMPDWWEHSGNMGNVGGEKLDHVTDREHWWVQATSDIKDITLYWHPDSSYHSFDEPMDSIRAHLRIAYADAHPNHAYWTNLGGKIADNATPDSGSITTKDTEINNIPFDSGNAKSGDAKIVTFASVKKPALVLPVELLWFEAHCRDGKVELQWQTASETDNSYFVVERSANAHDFDEIYRCAGAGTVNDLRTYTAYDIGNQLVTYYRLVAVDIDGQRSYSDIIVVRCSLDGSPAVRVFPNPVSSVLHIEAGNLSDSSLRFELRDNTGRLVFSEDYVSDGGAFTAAIDLSHLQPSVYMYRIICGDYLTNGKIVKR